jgi:hypothetical protein
VLRVSSDPCVWVPKMSSTSRDQAVFMDEPSEPIRTLNLAGLDAW